jgi:hypothetical protein
MYDPIETPEIESMGTPNSCKYSMTPSSAKARAAPPESTKPIVSPHRTLATKEKYIFFKIV